MSEQLKNKENPIIPTENLIDPEKFISEQQKNRSKNGKLFEKHVYSYIKNCKCVTNLTNSKGLMIKNNKTKIYENEKTIPDISFSLSNPSLKGLIITLDSTRSCRDRNASKIHRTEVLKATYSGRYINILVFPDDDCMQGTAHTELNMTYKNPHREIQNIDIAITNALWEGKFTGKTIYLKASWLPEFLTALNAYSFDKNPSSTTIYKKAVKILKEQHPEMHPLKMYKKYPTSRDMKTLCAARNYK